MTLKRPYAKGRKAELEYQKYLESRGYKVISAPKGNKFTKQKDLFGEWDLLAYIPYKHWLVVQIKSNNTGGVLKKLEKLSFELPKGTKAELVIRKDNKRTFEDRWDIRILMK